MKEKYRSEHQTNRWITARHAYIDVINWIDRNRDRFVSPKESVATPWGKIVESTRCGEGVQMAIIDKNALYSYLKNNGYDYPIIGKEWAKWKWIKLNSQGKFVHQTCVWGVRASYIMLYILPDVIDAIKADQYADDLPDPDDPKTDQCVNNLLSALKISEEADRARDFDFSILKYLAVQAERAAQRVYADDDITDPGEARRQVRECMSLIKDVVCEIERRFEE